MLRQVSLVEAKQLLEDVSLMPDAQSVRNYVEQALNKAEVSGLFSR
jgi:hypothetical protein